MDTLAFSLFTIPFWVIGIIFLFSALLTKKRKKSLISALICFCIPLVLVLGIDIDEQIEIYSFNGTYIGTDSLSNTVNIEIKNSEEIEISIKPCSKNIIKGTWTYVQDYDACLFYMDDKDIDISFGEYYRGGYRLKSNIKNECMNLTNVHLEKNRGYNNVNNTKRKIGLSN